MLRQLKFAAGPLLLDSLGVIIFAVLMALHASVLVATICGATIAVGMVVSDIVRGKPVPAMQWLSLALVVVSAGATLLTHDPRFVMAKPSIIYWVVGWAMLRPGWLNRYVIPEEFAVIGDLMTAFGYVWAGLMFVTGIANLVIAIAFPQWWLTFLAIFPTASKVVLFAVHFATLRIIGRRRVRAAA